MLEYLPLLPDQVSSNLISEHWYILLRDDLTHPGVVGVVHGGVAGVPMLHYRCLKLVYSITIQHASTANIGAAANMVVNNLQPYDSEG